VSEAGRATDNAIGFHEDDYLERLSLRDGECDHWAAVEPGSSDARLAEYLSRGGGYRYVALQSDDLAADVVAMRQRGVDVSDATEGGRRTPAGQELRWKAAGLGEKNPLPIFFIQHLTALDERRRQVARPGEHPNGALRLDRVYIGVNDLAPAVEADSPGVGQPAPEMQPRAAV